MIEVPERLGWWRDRTRGAAWLESLPQLAEECAERWSLRLGEPFGQAHVSLTAPVTLSDGGQAVLKLNFPEEESAPTRPMRSRIGAARVRYGCSRSTASGTRC